MSANVIFIAGIHGVGKSVACKSLCSEANIHHISASDLIRRAKNKVDEGKLVEDIGSNQNCLIEAFRETVNPDLFYVMDGHFCLLDSKRQIEKIPPYVFEVINPRGVLLLKDDIKNIHERLISRDDTKYDIELLDRFQECEIVHAQHICNRMNFPLYICNPLRQQDDMKDFVNNNLLGEG